jgi:single-stranded DNA-binding protein
MENKQKKKYYSYCSIGRQEDVFGTIEGIVLPIKMESYTKPDGTQSERMTFAISSKNVAEKIKHALKVTPVASTKNPENCFINCTAFGKNAQRLKQFIHEQDTVLVSGAISVYPTADGTGHRINMIVSDIKVLKYHNGANTNMANNQTRPAQNNNGYNNANNYNVNNNYNNTSNNTNNNNVNNYNNANNYNNVNNGGNTNNGNTGNANNYQNYASYGDDLPF